MIHASQIHNNRLREIEYLAGWQRAIAEIDNLRKRYQRQQDQSRTAITADIMQSLIPLVDNFQAIVKHMPSDLAGHPWAQGVHHVSRQINELLSTHGIQTIPAKNKQFNPNLHEAVSTVKKKGVASGVIVEVLQTGYTINDQIIRPSKVKIAK